MSVGTYKSGYDFLPLIADGYGSLGGYFNPATSGPLLLHMTTHAVFERKGNPIVAPAAKLPCSDLCHVHIRVASFLLFEDLRMANITLRYPSRMNFMGEDDIRLELALRFDDEIRYGHGPFLPGPYF